MQKQFTPQVQVNSSWYINHLTVQCNNFKFVEYVHNKLEHFSFRKCSYACFSIGLFTNQNRATALLSFCVLQYNSSLHYTGENTSVWWNLHVGLGFVGDYVACWKSLYIFPCTTREQVEASHQLHTARNILKLLNVWVTFFDWCSN